MIQDNNTNTTNLGFGLSPEWKDLVDGINFVDGQLFVHGIPEPKETIPTLIFNGKLIKGS